MRLGRDLRHTRVVISEKKCLPWQTEICTKARMTQFIFFIFSILTVLRDIIYQRLPFLFAYNCIKIIGYVMNALGYVFHFHFRSVRTWLYISPLTIHDPRGWRVFTHAAVAYVIPHSCPCVFAWSLRAVAPLRAIDTTRYWPILPYTQ